MEADTCTPIHRHTQIQTHRHRHTQRHSHKTHTETRPPTPTHRTMCADTSRKQSGIARSKEGQGLPAAPRSWTKSKILPEASTGARSCSHFDFGFLAPRAMSFGCSKTVGLGWVVLRNSYAWGEAGEGWPGALAPHTWHEPSIWPCHFPKGATV